MRPETDSSNAASTKTAATLWTLDSRPTRPSASATRPRTLAFRRSSDARTSRAFVGLSVAVDVSVTFISCPLSLLRHSVGFEKRVQQGHRYYHRRLRCTTDQWYISDRTSYRGTTPDKRGRAARMRSGIRRAGRAQALPAERSWVRLSGCDPVEAHPLPAATGLDPYPVNTGEGVPEVLLIGTGTITTTGTIAGTVVIVVLATVRQHFFGIESYVVHLLRSALQ